MLSNFENKFRKRSYEVFKTDLKPTNGIRELLATIKIPIGVASSRPVEKIRLNLITNNLIDFFGENILRFYHIGSWKPDPGIYLYATKQMDFKPEECVVIEDSVVGVKAAIVVGFNVFGFTHGKNKTVFEELGVTVFMEMNEPYQLLGID